MSVSSMTGFARTDGATVFEKKRCDWFFELKSVNGKSLDVKTKLPFRLESLSMFVKNKAAEYFSRGCLSVYLETGFDGETGVKINEELLSKLAERAVAVYEKYPEQMKKPSPGEILAVKGVVETVDDELSEDEESRLLEDLKKGFVNACNRLLQDRRAEGEKIARALTDILDKIAIRVEKIEIVAEILPQKLKERLKGQIKELLDADCQISEDRLVQEVCLYVARADIREEIDRLKAHVKTARQLLSSGEAVGRRLDFLCQELNREANTTCSKSCDIEITNLGMELKTLIEQFREQVQNME